MFRFSRTAATVFTAVGLAVAIAPSAGAATTAHSEVPAATVSATPTVAGPTEAGHYSGDCDYDQYCSHDGNWYWYYDADDDCWRWYYRAWDHDHYWNYYRDHDSHWGYRHHNEHWSHDHGRH